MHAVALAAELGIRKVVIPRAADVFSAWGMLMSDLRRDYFVTRLLSLNAGNAGRLDALLDEVTGACAASSSRGEGIAAEQVRFLRFGNLRYENQEHGVEVPLPDGEIDAAAVEAIADGFHDAYEREYTYRLDAPVEFVGAHVVAIAEVGKLAPAPLPATGRPLERRAEGQAERRLRDSRASTRRTSTTASCSSRAWASTARRSSRRSGSTVVVHPGNEADGRRLRQPDRHDRARRLEDATE